MRKLLFIGLIYSSIFLVGCFKEEVKKEVIENTYTGVLKTGSLEVDEINKSNSGVLYNNTGSKNIDMDIEEDKFNNKYDEKKIYILSENKLITGNIKDIEKDYKNIVLSDKIIYYKNEEDLQNYIGTGCGEYQSVESCFNYSKEYQSLIEIKNISLIEGNGFGSRKGDIYENGNLLINDFPFGCWDGCEWPIYDKKNGIISVKEGRGDVCAGFNTNRQYDLKTKKFTSYTDNFNGCFVENRSISFGEKENNIIDIYYYKNEKSSFNSYSVFSISKGDFKRNYIYDSNLKIESKEDFMNVGNNVNYFLGGKEFKIDFDELEKSKEKMSLLYGGGGRNANFDYGIYLKKQGNNYTIHFDKIKSEVMSSEKIVNDIGIISCKSNFSKEYDNEYILKTKDINGNYKYNISEKLNNKCDIPYEINIYYTDGTNELGEYYVLFDY